MIKWITSLIRFLITGRWLSNEETSRRIRNILAKYKSE